MTGVELIAQERQRQIGREGWDDIHDDEHRMGELAVAAACYAAPETIFVRRNQPARFCDPWPWDAGWDKRTKHSRERQLVIAGALIAAELDRLQRLDAAGVKAEEVSGE